MIFNNYSNFFYAGFVYIFFLVHMAIADQWVEMQTFEMPGEKARLKWHKNPTRCFEQIKKGLKNQLILKISFYRLANK